MKTKAKKITLAEIKAIKEWILAHFLKMTYNDNFRQFYLHDGNHISWTEDQFEPQVIPRTKLEETISLLVLKHIKNNCIYIYTSKDNYNVIFEDPAKIQEDNTMELFEQVTTPNLFVGFD